MPDVITKAKTSGIINNGGVIIYADKLGNYQRIIPNNNEAAQTGSGVELKYTNRFDDPTYYTA